MKIEAVKLRMVYFETVNPVIRHCLILSVIITKSIGRSKLAIVQRLVFVYSIHLNAATRMPTCLLSNCCP